MIACPRCGSPNNPDASRCASCGVELDQAKDAKKGGLGATAVMASPIPAPSVDPGPSGAPPPAANEAPRTTARPADERPPNRPSESMKKTMVGMAPEMSAPAPQPPGKLKSTMLGMPAIAPVGAAPIATPAPAPSPLRGPGLAGGGKQTIIGVAAPAVQPSGDGRGGGSARPPAEPEHKKTMMGVAMPGIAPLAPGVPKESAPAEPIAPDPGTLAPGQVPPQPEQPAFQPAATYQSMPEEPRRRSSHPPPPPQARSQYSATIALVSGLVLAVAAAAFAFLWRSPAPLRAEARVDATGTDMLHITCTTCPDGTELRIGDAKAKVTSQGADIALAHPLGVGENVFTVDVDRPASGRDEKVSLIVKIGYRIRPDLSGLDSDRPVLRILVDGAPLAKMVIDGKPLDLGQDGKGSYDIDITSDCTGPSDETKTLERSVPYSVAGTSGAAEQGSVGLRVAVTPLHLDAPTTHAVIEGEQFLLGGRTGRGGRLIAGGNAIAVAADGSFSRQMPAKTIGDNTVSLRATVPGLAPRLASVRVKRVEKLSDEARAFSASAPLAFGDLAADVNKHVGEPIVLQGDIVESRQQGAKNLALLDVQKGCPRPPCVARVVFAASEAIAKGDRLQVFGHVTRAISAKGEAAGAVPEVEGDFFLKRK